MLLKDYLKMKGLLPFQFAKRIGLDPSVIYNALNGKRKLSRRSAEIIDKFTNGKVSCFEALWPEKFKSKK